MSQPGCPSATKHARPVLDSPAAGRSATDGTGSGEQSSANSRPSKEDKPLAGEKRQRGPAEDPLVRIPDAGFTPEQMNVLMKAIQDQVKTTLEAQRAVTQSLPAMHPLGMMNPAIMPHLPTSSPYHPSAMHLGTLLQAALPVGGHAWNLQPKGHILPHQQAVIRPAAAQTSNSSNNTAMHADPCEVKKRQKKEISDLKIRQGQDWLAAISVATDIIAPCSVCKKKGRSGVFVFFCSSCGLRMCKIHIDKESPKECKLCQELFCPPCFDKYLYTCGCGKGKYCEKCVLVHLEQHRAQSAQSHSQGDNAVSSK